MSDACVTCDDYVPVDDKGCSRDPKVKRTASNIVSRNGYLFMKTTSMAQSCENIAERPTATVDNNLHSTSYMSAFEGSLERPKKTVRIKNNAKFYNRYKYFESLPKYSLEQPCINIASPYVGSEEQKLRKEQLEMKKRWITQRGFQTNFKSNKEDAKLKGFLL